MIDFLLPKTCPVCICLLTSSTICKECLISLPYINNNKVCEIFWVTNNGLNTEQKFVCGNCISKTASHIKARLVLFYKDEPRELLHEFQYSSKMYLADIFADIILDNFPYKFGEIDVIVAVPLHIKRLRSRWYNQSALVSKVLAKNTGLALDLYSLKK